MKLIAVLPLLAALAAAHPATPASGRWECADEVCAREVAVGTAELHYPALGHSVDVPDGTTLDFSEGSAPDFDDAQQIPGAVVRRAVALDLHLDKRADSGPNMCQKLERQHRLKGTDRQRRKFPGCRELRAENKSAHNCTGKHYFCCKVRNKTAKTRRSARLQERGKFGMFGKGNGKGKGSGGGKDSKTTKSAEPETTGSWGINSLRPLDHVQRKSMDCTCGHPNDYPGAEHGDCYA